MWAASDDALLAGMAAGDADAALAFVRRHQSRVYGLARSMIADDGVAEDVAQEAFVRAWRAAGTYDPRRGAVVTWLLAVTRNLGVDALRMRRAAPMDPDDVVLACLADGRPEPADVAAASDEAARLRAAVADLPLVQRRALVQAAFLGRTAREISEDDGIPLGTAKTRIRSAVINLRDALGATVE